MSYRETSSWNKRNELQCLLIFKKLQKDKFRRGLQIDYSRTLATQTNLDAGSISAKVCNYKSVAGVNTDSNASSNTKDIYKQYGHLSIQELTNIMNSEDDMQ